MQSKIAHSFIYEDITIMPPTEIGLPTRFVCPVGTLAGNTRCQAHEGNTLEVLIVSLLGDAICLVSGTCMGETVGLIIGSSDLARIPIS